MPPSRRSRWHLEKSSWKGTSSEAVFVRTSFEAVSTAALLGGTSKSSEILKGILDGGHMLGYSGLAQATEIPTSNQHYLLFTTQLAKWMRPGSPHHHSSCGSTA